MDFFRKKARRRHALATSRLLIFTFFFALYALTATAQPKETPSGFPVPRFVSLKDDRVNVREGPSQEHKVLWIYIRKGIPVEVIAEAENWRRIRDKDGSMGWVHANLLDGRRSIIVEGNDLAPMRARAQDNARPVAWAEPGVVLRLKKCVPAWCEVAGPDVNGWIERPKLWGIYPDEIVK